MTSITVNLTLEQILEFVQNLPSEYKKAVKHKLETEEVEEIEQNEINEEPKNSLVDQIAGISKDDNLPDYKTLRDEAIVARYREKEERADKEQKEREQKEQDEKIRIEEKRAIVESLAGKWKLPDDFDYKEEYRKLITKKYTQE